MTDAVTKAGLELAEAHLRCCDQGGEGAEFAEAKAREAYRAAKAAAEPRLRTRAEVDADIARVIRGYRARNSFKPKVEFCAFSSEERCDLNRLCDEKTREPDEHRKQPERQYEVHDFGKDTAIAVPVDPDPAPEPYLSRASNTAIHEELIRRAKTDDIAAAWVVAIEAPHRPAPEPMTEAVCAELLELVTPAPRWTGDAVAQYRDQLRAIFNRIQDAVRDERRGKP